MAARDISDLAAPRRTADQYDLLLAAIPLAFALGAVVAAVAGEPLRTGVTTGGVLAGAATAYALFGAPPTGERPRSRGPTR
ncbi:MAG: hypothetical protein ABEJ76_00140 [Halanaeroarchaeum sp.]